MGFYAMLISYGATLYYILQAIFSISGTGTPFYVYSGILLALAMFMFFKEIILRRYVTRNEMCVIAVCFFMLLAYWATGVIYGYNDLHSTYLKSSFGRFLPAILMGIVASRDSLILTKMGKYARLFALLYTIASVMCVFRVNVSSLNSNLLVYNVEGGVTYQDISYFAAFAFGLNLFVLIQDNGLKNHRLNTYLDIALLIVDFFCVAAAGGRGGFVLVCVYSLYFLFTQMSTRNALRVAGIVLVVVIAIGMLGSNTRLSFGLNRILYFFSQKENISGDNRWERYILAFQGFTNSPILGNGIGSIFYIIGFYSHDIFTDFLCEGGLLLFSAFIGVLVISYSKYRRMKNEEGHELLVVIFMASFVLLLFSGYYMQETGIWFVLSFLLCHTCFSNEKEG